MPRAQVLHGRQEAVELVERRHRDVDHGHQLSPLLGHVALEQGSQRGIELEKPAIEKLGGGVLDRQHLGPGALHEAHLFWCHLAFSYFITMRSTTPPITSPSLKSVRGVSLCPLWQLTHAGDTATSG